LISVVQRFVHKKYLLVGAMVNWKSDQKIEWQHSVTKSRVFPDRDDQITGLFVMARTSRGVILENTGLPMLIMLRQVVDPLSRRDSSTIRLPAGLETESDQMLVLKYRKKQDLSDQLVRNVFKVKIDNWRPNPPLLSRQLNLVNSGTFASSLLDDSRTSLKWQVNYLIC